MSGDALIQTYETYRVSYDDDALTGEAFWLSILRRMNDRIWESVLKR